MGKELYSILGISKGADSSEIKKAYKKLVMTEHPDKGGSEERFKEIQGAYEILSDDQKKSYYDQTGELPGENGGGGGGGNPFGFPGNPFGGGSPFGGSSPFGGGGAFPFDIRDLFGNMGRGPRAGPTGNGPSAGKAPARSTQLPLGLHDFYHGKTFRINLERQKFCSGCKGEGSKVLQSCSACHGNGTVRQIIQMGPMVMESNGPCPQCSGQGKQKGEACGDCAGSCFVKQQKDLEIHIKPGMKPGDTLVFAGESSDVQGYKEAGDVSVELQAADENHCWVRDGTTLKTTVKLCLSESLLGTVISLPGHPGFPAGCVFAVKSGVQHIQVLKYKGLGMPLSGKPGSFGELHVTFNVTPTSEELSVLQSQKMMLESLFKVPARQIPEGTVHTSE
jgi:DnaJ family protein A protein 2